MLKTVLWIAAACAAVLLALAVSRWMAFDKPPAPPPEPPAPAVVEVPPPPVELPVPVAAAPPPTPEDAQIQEDAAATGMTTIEPDEPPKE